MRCLHCGKRLALLRQITHEEFCCADHRRQYQEEQDRLAVARVQEVERRFRRAASKASAPAPEGPRFLDWGPAEARIRAREFERVDPAPLPLSVTAALVRYEGGVIWSEPERDEPPSCVSVEPAGETALALIVPAEVIQAVTPPALPPLQLAESLSGLAKAVSWFSEPAVASAQVDVRPLETPHALPVAAVRPEPRVSLPHPAAEPRLLRECGLQRIGLSGGTSGPEAVWRGVPLDFRPKPVWQLSLANCLRTTGLEEAAKPAGTTPRGPLVRLPAPAGPAAWKAGQPGVSLPGLTPVRPARVPSFRAAVAPAPAAYCFPNPAAATWSWPEPAAASIQSSPHLPGCGPLPEGALSGVAAFAPQTPAPAAIPYAVVSVAPVQLESRPPVPVRPDMPANLGPVGLSSSVPELEPAWVPAEAAGRTSPLEIRPGRPAIPASQQRTRLRGLPPVPSAGLPLPELQGADPQRDFTAPSPDALPIELATGICQPAARLLQPLLSACDDLDRTPPVLNPFIDSPAPFAPADPLAISAASPMIPPASELATDNERFLVAPPFLQVPLGHARRLFSPVAGFWKKAPADLKWVSVAIPLIVVGAVLSATLGGPIILRRPASPARPSAAAQVEGATSFMHVRWERMKQNILSRAAINLQDDFRTGLADWEGRGRWAKEWSYDPAGFVRPGSLALFKPSRELGDYQMEFLAQIEKKSLGWVFRARDLDNYYAARIVLNGTGPLPTASLQRWAVIGGKETARHQAPLPVNVRPDMLYRVRLEVNGSSFSTFIHGQMVDFFSDERLAAGGVGFFNAKGELSRLRWVTVSHHYDVLGRLCALLAPYELHARQGGIDQ